MHILYLHPKSWTGEKTILPVLRDLGHEVCVLEEKRGLQRHRWVCTDYFEKSGDRIPTCWYDPGRGWEKLATWLFDRVFRHGFEGRNLVHRMWMIMQGVRHFQPDVILCSDGFTYAIPSSLLRQAGLLRIPLVSSYIGGDILDCPHAEIGRSRKGMTGWLIKRSYPGFDLLRPVSPMLKRILLADGVPDERIRVCPSHLVASAKVTEPILARKMDIRRQMRLQWGIEGKAPLIVTLSANIRGKGLHVLAKAWPTVLKANPAARWLLCGPESRWLREQVTPILERFGVGHTVIHAGSLSGDSVFEHLACADLHVNPSLCEGLNMVTVEAGVVGTPTITTSATGIASWIERFGAGQVVPAAEDAPLADAIINAISKPRVLSDWSAAAVQMSGEFAPDRVAREILDILQSAINLNFQAR